MMSEKIGIIAGSGQFPRLIARQARKNGFGVAICGFYANADPDLAQECDAFTLLHLGQLKKMLDFFHDAGVKRLCLAGAISKPKALDLRPDLRVTRLLFSLRTKGDDAILRAFMTELESEGFMVVNPADLVPDLRAPAGILGAVKPSDIIRANVTYGWPIAVSIGRFDIGQGLVVRENMVMAVECLEGTDAMLCRGAELGGKGCVALKTVKPKQDMRADLPSIGLQTIQQLTTLHYAALVIEADSTLFFDREASIALADQHNLCLWALTRADIETLCAEKYMD